MKTSFLVLKLKSMGYQVKVKPLVTGKDQMKGKVIFVYTSDGNYAGHVCTKVFGTLSTDTWVTTSGNLLYSPQGINGLVEALTTYALTSLDKREDTKKYLVKMLPKGYNYLNQNRADNHLFSASSDETDEHKTEFTEEEYNKLQERYAIWLPKFDKDDPRFIEVHDDENSEPMTNVHDSELMYPDEEFTRTYSYLHRD